MDCHRLLRLLELYPPHLDRDALPLLPLYKSSIELVSRAIRFRKFLRV